MSVENEPLEYKVNHPISVDQFIDVLKASTLGERRPIDDLECIKGMVENANLIVTCWDDDKLVGVSRSVTDFHYACYLSDLAVDQSYQQQGIGKKLIDLTEKELGKTCKLILLAAPAASEYYQPLGFEKHDRCWIRQQ